MKQKFEFKPIEWDWVELEYGNDYESNDDTEAESFVVAGVGWLLACVRLF